MSVVGNVVIVKGLATTGTSERALDSDTLLVFEDRKVLGYVGSWLILIYLSI
jgi:H/ACA ribonucleoprotein complex non-core subunit NAF1